MKLCPQCEFIYEDDQKFCDMDGQELVRDPKPRAFTDDTAALPSLAQVLKSNHAAPQSDYPAVQSAHAVAQSVHSAAAAAVTKIHIPLPASGSDPAANAAAGVPAKASSGWRPRGLAIAALAGLALVALLFVVYYARTHQSQTRKANRSASQVTESAGQSHAQPATQSAAQTAAPVVPDSATPLGEAPASEQTLDQTPSEQPADAVSTEQTTLQASSIANGSDKSVSRVRQTSTVVAARASSETSRAPVIIRLNNGASIKADEAWEKKEGVWYRQAGMVTFLKRSRVKSIQRPASTRSQLEPKAEKSVAQNQPRVGKPDAANSKKDSKVTSFLKTTGRVLKKPFKF